MLDRYVAQIRLLLSVLPDIATEKAFALKGGTAAVVHLAWTSSPLDAVSLGFGFLLGPHLSGWTSCECLSWNGDEELSSILVVVGIARPNLTQGPVRGDRHHERRGSRCDEPSDPGK